MSSPISASISGHLSGATFQGALTPVDFGLLLDAQNAHIQLAGSVASGGGTKAIAVPQGLGLAADVQHMFLFKSDLPLTVQLNSDASLTFTLTKAQGLLLFVGGPLVTQIDLTNAGANTAKFHMTTIYGPA